MLPAQQPAIVVLFCLLFLKVGRNFVTGVLVCGRRICSANKGQKGSSAIAYSSTLMFNSIVV